MKAKLEIPKVWRRLRDGEKVKKGDCIFDDYHWQWVALREADVGEVGEVVRTDEVIIRKKRRK